MDGEGAEEEKTLHQIHEIYVNWIKLYESNQKGVLCPAQEHAPNRGQQESENQDHAGSLLLAAEHANQSDYPGI